MNFLAHISLSPHRSTEQVGNFLGDFIRGSELQSFESEIVKGVQVHRFIDEYTDNHPVVEDLRETLRSDFRKFAGVVIDVYFDHFLANNWSDYRDDHLPTFADEFYDHLGSFKDVLPLGAERFYGYMTSNKVLTAYGEVEGIGRVLRGMSNRTSFESGMERGAEVLERDYHALSSAFDAFYPDLHREVQKFRASL